MGERIAMFIGGAAGLLVLFCNMGVIAHHFDDLTSPPR